MALNLSKKDQDNNESSSSKKKGLNLSKSDSSPKNKFNLSKEELDTSDSQGMPSEQIEEKKKSSVLYIIVAVVIIGIGGYWFMSQKSGSQDTSSNQPVDSVTTKVEPTQPEVDSANLAGSSATTPTDVQPVTSSNSPDASKESATVETSSPKSTISGNSSSSVEQKAREVIDGKFGNGEDRKLALGSNYKAIQAKVNALYRSQKQ
jgi:hypothetical protein